MKFYVERLDSELKAAGIPILGCSSDGRVDFKDEATAEHRRLAEEVKARHDPTPLPKPPTAEERLAALEQENATLRDRIAAVEGRLGIG